MLRAPFLSELKGMILDEVCHVQGLMRLLMKQRNRQGWSAEDKAAILFHLRHLAKSIPLLAVFSFPGGSLLLPLLVWFLDRRKKRRIPAVRAVAGDTPLKDRTTLPP